MHRAVTSIRPDGSDALQAWMDVTADDVVLRMLLDTGSAGTDVPRVEPFASRLTDASTTGKSAFGTVSSTPVALVHALHVGDLVVDDLLVGVQPADWPHPPLLGMDVLAPHMCHFRFSAERLDMDGEAPSSAWMSLATGEGIPAVDVAWGQTIVSAIWDTGAGMTLIDETWASAHPDVVAILPERGTGTDSSGETRSGQTGMLAACRIGDVDFGEQLCGIVDFSGFNGESDSPLRMFVGLPLMSQANWVFDFPRGRWTVYR